MTTILLVIQFVLAALIVIAVLLQKSSSIGLGAYSGSNESLFGAKGAGSFLTKATFVIAIAFVVNTLALGYFYNSEKKSSLIDDIKVQQSVPSSASAPSAPTAPVAPTAPKGE